MFVPTDEKSFGMLDAHADSIETDIKLPLVVLGDEGTGKSAMLANWVSKRRLTKHRDEFLFQHFVECSIQSSQVPQRNHLALSARYRY